MPEDIYQAIVRLRREQTLAALATIVDTKGSTPGKLAQKMVVLGDGSIIGTIGGGCLEADVIRSALDCLDTGLPRKMQFSLSGLEAERTGLACGGKLEVMVEPLNEPEVYVVGCGHVGAKIADLAARSGFKLTVFDDRPDFANAEKFPDADRVVCAELDDIGKHLSLGPNCYLISVTRGHNHDYEVMKWALGTPVRFIGIIGSRAKKIQFFKDLEKEGHPTSDRERIKCPVGLDIGAKNPDEIAVSVVAELISLRRRGQRDLGTTKS
ncbi:MAG: XdhC/CoxI family protein [Planctomycetota bacterium]